MNGFNYFLGACEAIVGAGVYFGTNGNVGLTVAAVFFSIMVGVSLGLIVEKK